MNHLRFTNSLFGLWCLLALLLSYEAQAKRYPKASDALEHLVAIEYHRNPNDPFLKKALYHPTKKVVRAAMLAHGRIGDPRSVEALAPFLRHHDPDLSKRAAFSISLIGGDFALALLSQHAQMDKQSRDRGSFWRATGRVGNEKTVRLFYNALQAEKDRRTQAVICEGLGILWNRSFTTWEPPKGLLKLLAELSTKPDPVASAAGFALSRYKGPTEEIPRKELVTAVNNAGSLDAKLFLTRVLARVPTPEAQNYLVTALQKSGFRIRVEAANSLGWHKPTKLALITLNKALVDKHAAVTIAALHTATRWNKDALPLAPNIEKLYKKAKSHWVKATALRTLAAIDPTRAKDDVTTLIAKEKSPIVAAGYGALGHLGSKEAIDALATAIRTKPAPIASKAAESLRYVDSLSLSDNLKSAINAAIFRKDVALTIVLCDLIRSRNWTVFAKSLSTVFPTFSNPDGLEAKIAILNTLRTLGDRSPAVTVKKALSNPNRLIAQAAADTLQSLTGENAQSKVPLNSKLRGPSPSSHSLNKALNATITMTTTRGTIVLKLNKEAPLSAFNFYQLVKQNFYDGKTFHRVASNFVVQGGDPRGDGFGGPGYFIRDEVSHLKHTRGTVGMATAGKDTGGSQFFFNTTPNYHLDGRYTLFASVTSGMNVVDRLQVGDKILKVRATP